MPTGAVLNSHEWTAIAEICRRESLWLIYNASTERILFDRRSYVHPASLDGIADRVITIGSVSKEFRMIGWRVGWVVAQGEVIEKIGRAHIYNVVTPIGIAQTGALAAIQAANDGVDACVREWQARRDIVLDQLATYPVVRPGGGWSLLVETAAMKIDPVEASQRLLRLGKVAATPMLHWGEAVAPRYLRLVFSNEPRERLNTLRERFGRALG
jgi:aspartate/methionine/tyrosine aminotransferase